jgi:C4-dicarboxylate-specific signal transduction histidine kinase
LRVKWTNQSNATSLAADLVKASKVTNLAETGGLRKRLIDLLPVDGFPEGRAGEVEVQLQPASATDNAPEARWCLTVRDTGVGLSPDFEEKRQLSLGLQLVQDLSDQLGGALDIVSTAGQRRAAA